MKNNLLMLLIASFTLFSCASNEKPVVEELIEIEELEFDNQVQVLEPVTWEYSTEKIAENEYLITFNANIQENWFVYSSVIEGMGPIPTSIIYDENETIESFSEISESGDIVEDGYDEMFELDIKKFGGKASFSQTVKTSGATSISGYLEYMTCDSIQCLFPDPIEFSFEAK